VNYSQLEYLMVMAPGCYLDQESYLLQVYRSEKEPVYYLDQVNYLQLEYHLVTGLECYLDQASCLLQEYLMVRELECYLVRVNHYHLVSHLVKVVVKVKESHYYLE
jgi:hypothetical protein